MLSKTIFSWPFDVEGIGLCDEISNESCGETFDEFGGRCDGSCGWLYSVDCCCLPIYDSTILFVSFWIMTPRVIPTAAQITAMQ